MVVECLNASVCTFTAAILFIPLLSARRFTDCINPRANARNEIATDQFLPFNPAFVCESVVTGNSPDKYPGTCQRCTCTGGS